MHRILICCMLIFVCAGCKENRDIRYRSGPTDLLKKGERRKVIRIKMTPNVKKVLDKSVHFLMKDEKVASSRKFYGNIENMIVVLRDGGSEIGWPKNYRPKIEGVKFINVPKGKMRFDRKPVILGLDISSLVIVGDEATAAFVMFNLRGKNVIGGAYIVIKLNKINGKWEAKLMELQDP